jgi:aminoglycoside phosphotransferase (APT) family kinase protein
MPDTNTTSTVETLSYLRDVLPQVIPEILRIEHGDYYGAGSHYYSYYFDVSCAKLAVSRIIVRVPRAWDSNIAHRISKEHSILSYLQSTGFSNAPISLWCDCTCTHISMPFSVQEYIDDSRRPHLSERQLMRDFARLLARLHSLSVPSNLLRSPTSGVTWQDFLMNCIGNMYSWYGTLFNATGQSLAVSSFLTQMSSIVANSIDLIRAEVHADSGFLEDTVDQESILHGDVGEHNIRVSQTGLYLIDWEFATVGDPATDVGKFIRDRTLTNGERQKFISDYLYMNPISQQRSFQTRVTLYEKLGAVQSVIWACSEFCEGTASSISTDDLGWYLNSILENVNFIDSDLRQQAESVMRGMK